MPAFDPVRDAVLNSPLSASDSLPSRMHIDLPPPPRPPAPAVPSSSSSPSSRPPSSAPGTPSSAFAILHPPPTPAIPSPSPSESTPAGISPIARRATDLAVLLNSDPPPQDTPLFTPTTPRAPATLSHLLLPDTPDVPEPDQLAHLAPLRRRPAEAGATSANPEGSYFAFSWPGSAAGTRLGSVPAPDTPLEHPGLALPAPHGYTATRSPAPPPASTNTAPASRPSTSSSRPATSVGTLQPSPPPQRSTVSPAMPPPPAPQPPRSPSLQPSPASVSTATLSSTSPQPHSARSTPARSPVSGPPPRSTATPTDSPAPAEAGTKTSSVPYAPRRRTPATSVLIPLSPAEMEKYRHFQGGVGTMLLRKRKREQQGGWAGMKRDERDRAWGDEEEEEEGVRKRRKTGDVGLVVEHYNARPEVGVTQRQDSPIIGLKNFNNWVKSVLITRFAHPVLAASPDPPGAPPGMGARRGGRGRVLDLGCGKGGDLTKWAKARIREYVGVDIAAVSVDQARERYLSTRGGPRFAASFHALDCYTHALRIALAGDAALARPFDAVSLQFCMHYAFESARKARTMLANVAGSLRAGGVFIGTVPDAAQLMDRLDALPAGAQDLSWGNSVYRIRFEDRASRPVFGHRYWFFLKDAVDDVPEYVVHWDDFVR
ncbi:hypothetical protein AcV5_005759 [Taiwanofungus camphoratus]|nr:hypothetical protein AcV5_005759 [Antrodia cinnamomea]